jgi:hypothetical protein
MAKGDLRVAILRELGKVTGMMGSWVSAKPRILSGTGLKPSPSRAASAAREWLAIWGFIVALPLEPPDVANRSIALNVNTV